MSQLLAKIVREFIYSDDHYDNIYVDHADSDRFYS